MSRLGFGMGFGVNNIVTFGGGGSEIFNANVAEFNGSSSFLISDNDFNYQNKSAFYTSFWIKPTSSTAQQGTIYSEETGNNLFARVICRLGSSNLRLLVGGRQTASGSFIGSESGDILTLNTWQHVVAGVDTATGDHKIYVNGSLVYNSNFTWAGNISNSTSVVNPRVGKYINDASPQWLEGDLFNLDLSDEVLVSDDVSALYNDGVAQCFDLLASSTQSKLDVRWPLENHDGFMNQETVDQTGSGNNATNNSVTFTGSAQIECNG